MTGPQPIGEIIRPILQRCEDMSLLHGYLRSLRSPCTRKEVILSFFEQGSITREEASLLLEAYMLETA